MKKRAVTLLEIVVATVIFASVMAGLMNIFVAAKRYIIHARSRMTGGELGKVFLTPLQMSVRQDTWDDSNNPLATGTRYCDSNATHPQQPYCPYASNRTFDRVVYDSQYEISDIANTTLRKVVLRLNWNETSP
jgi:type II secretory pathway pseudopilin PulG